MKRLKRTVIDVGNMFDKKLGELSRQYELMQSRLNLCRGGEREQLKIELNKASAEYENSFDKLMETAANSRSPAVSALAAAQADYFKKAEEALKKKLPEYMRSEAGVKGENVAEAEALYAEYAVDFAVQAMKYAAITVMAAVEAQFNLVNN